MPSPDGAASRMASTAVWLRFVGNNLPARRLPQGLSHREGAPTRRITRRCPVTRHDRGYARSTL
jgi:hypothetical protein